MNKIRGLFSWFGWKSKLILVLLINGAIGWYAINIGFNLGRTHSISKLPNSCFVDSVVFASNANYILSNENTWAQIYAFQFHYKDDLRVDVDFNKTLLEYKVQIPKFHGHAICIFEYKNMLWVYDSNYGTMPVGPVGNRNEYHLRITNWIEDKYKAIVFNSILIDDDQGKTTAWIRE
ncbi:MAG: hypothetical protein EBU90_12975 [Proteobacteria bacterium]|nr:hypothetical protein [Pseudomonadota bacterium]